jgi:hypothetical protein
MQQVSQKLNIVNVFFEDEQYNYSTNVSSKTTKEDAEKYFVGAWFNVGSYPSEIMRKVIKIEFINQN